MISERILLNETNMLLKCDIREGIKKAVQEVKRHRKLLEGYIAQDPFFLLTLSPYFPKNGPKIANRMANTASVFQVGPMAAVAGAIADVAAEAMKSANAHTAIAANGGDISIKSKTETTVGIYAGDIPLSGKIGFRLRAQDLPAGVCTSSGKIGPSISFGDAHAVTVVARDAIVADAAATAIGNRVKEKDPEKSIQSALEYAEPIKEVMGCLILAGNFVGRTGRLPEIIEIESLNLAEV